MTETQSIAFEKKLWTPKKARSWLKKHNLKPIKRNDRARNFIIFRLQNPEKFSGFRVKILPGGIHLILGIRMSP